MDLAGIKQLVGVQTYGHMASEFRANEDSMTAEGWLSTRTGGVRTSRRIAAAVNAIQRAIIRRDNPAATINRPGISRPAALRASGAESLLTRFKTRRARA